MRVCATAMRAWLRHRAPGARLRRRAAGLAPEPEPVSRAEDSRARPALGLRQRSLHEHPLDTAVVGLGHVLRHPPLAEDAVSHLDDDVIGLEQAAGKVALVALQALQAARAGCEDLQVALGCVGTGARRDPRPQSRLVLAQLLFLAKAHLRRDVGPRDAEGAALAAAAIALLHVLADERFHRDKRLAQLHRAVARIVEQIARPRGIGAARAAERDALLEQV